MMNMGTVQEEPGGCQTCMRRLSIRHLDGSWSWTPCICTVCDTVAHSLPTRRSRMRILLLINAFLLLGVLIFLIDAFRYTLSP